MPSSPNGATGRANASTASSSASTPTPKFPGGIFHTLDKHRYEGWFVGAGVGLGYQLVLNRRWSLEAEVGAGYAYLDYDKYRCNTCGNLEASKTKDYFGLTKAGLSVVYVIR